MSSATEPLTFYVAPDGDDAWSGRLPQPDTRHTDGPFATLEQARDHLRTLRAAGALHGPVTVQVREGTYYLDQPFVLTQSDSGTPDSPVSYIACPGEKPVLSGGRVITGWRPYRGEILQAELPGSRGGKWAFRQLFYGGKRMTRARWPKPDPVNPLYGGWAMTAGAATEGSTTAFHYSPGTFAHHWARPTEVEVVYFSGSGQWHNRVPIRSINEERRAITLAHAGLQFDVPGWYQVIPFTRDNRFYVENGLEDLTRPGEWCFDSEEGLLYFWPPREDAGHSSGDSPISVVIPRLDCLIDLRGAAWVTIAGLTFTHTLDGDNHHHEGVEGAGAMYPRHGWRYSSDALHLKDAQHCHIEGNLFDAVGGNAIYLEGYNARNVITHNEVAAAGANGICLLGSRLRHPLFNHITDNNLHHCGAINKYTAGVFCGMSDGNIISHNRFEHLPHHAINLSNNPFGRNFVEYNEIRWADEEIADSAALNCWMEEPPDRDTQRCGHVIRFNLIADTRGCEVFEGHIQPGGQYYPTSGIYLDNYTSNCFVYGNVIVRCSSIGIVVHAGKNNVIENNLLVDCPVGICLQDYVSTMDFWKLMAGFMTGNHLLRNILYQPDGTGYLIRLYNWTDRTIAQSEGNVFWQRSEASYRLQDLDAGHPFDYATWQRRGYDRDSLIVDPLFTDAAHDDYRLRPDSPALALGFQPIDLHSIGIRPSQAGDTAHNPMQQAR